MDKQPQGTNPGICWVSSKLTKPDKFPADDFANWYDWVHIPNLMKLHGIDWATRYLNYAGECERPYLTLYPLEDLADLSPQKLKTVPLTDPSLPESYSIYDLAEFDVRMYKYTQLYEDEDPVISPFEFVASAAYTPQDEKDCDDWYRQEHLEVVSKITGWQRTERYELVSANTNGLSGDDDPLGERPKFLTLHYFAGESLNMWEFNSLGEGPWSERVLSNMKKIELQIFRMK